MDIFRLTRELVDIESITGNEAAVGSFLLEKLSSLGYNARKMLVEGSSPSAERFNVFAVSPEFPSPQVVFSTHMDTVPPHIPSSEDDERIYGRGACDAKGIIAAQIAACEQLRAQRVPAALLFLAGEERDSEGAKRANLEACGAKFLINGEPTENRIGIASKGTLRVELRARGRMAHSAYPHLGESAIDKLLQALARLRAMPLPSHPQFGETNFNIGLIEGGRAPNVIPDLASAQLLYRLTGDSQKLREEIVRATGDLAEVEFGLEIPFVRLRAVDGIPTMVAAYTTDIPSLNRWGTPVLFGPGSIHVAHTDGEHVAKKQLVDAVDLYAKIAKELLSS